MNYNLNCDLCQTGFSISVIPYELPCGHLYCYKCLESLSESDSLTCKKDELKFSFGLDRIPISNKFALFLIPNHPIIVCSEHNNKEIEFICSDHNAFLCSFCFFEHCDHKKNTKFYNSKNLFSDIQLLEKKLSEMLEKITTFTKSLEGIKNEKFLDSEQLSPLLSQISAFIKMPFCSQIREELEDYFPFSYTNKVNIVFPNQINQISDDSKQNIETKLSSKAILETSSFETKLFKEKQDFLFLSGILNFGSIDKLSQKLTLLYRGSDHSFKADKFHSLCDNKGPTITLIKSNKGKVFGGYSKASWHSNNTWSPSEGSFLFSVDHKSKHEIYQNRDNAIYGYKTYGPTFGGSFDIKIVDSCNSNAENYSNFGSTYKPPEGLAYLSEGARSYLGGSYKFVVEDYEVYSVNLE